MTRIARDSDSGGHGHRPGHGRGVATPGRQNNDVIVIRSTAIIMITFSIIMITLPRDVTVARLPRRLAALIKIMIMIVFVIMIMIIFMTVEVAERTMRISQQPVGPLVKLVKITIGWHQNNNWASSK